jgi:CheY-like chemotaxis protein
VKTCLVVDDSRVIRKVARRVLEDIGFEIAEAADGMEALAWCRAAMPDAVLLDWNMPVMNGIEFLRQLRSGSRAATRPRWSSARSRTASTTSARPWTPGRTNTS